jgi:arsenite methyltransferase
LGLGEANLRLGCGNPLAIAELKEGETVLDLGSGAGFGAFLSAMKVGKHGYIIGVDMTPEMVIKSKENAEKLGFANVDFRHGDIEHLPVDDNSVDVIISNCVINLSPNKQAVFQETFRVLKPKGRIAISDILKKGEFSDAIRQNEAAYSGWITGAVSVEELKKMLGVAGFVNITIKGKEKSDEIIRGWNFGEGVEDMVFSAYIKQAKLINYTFM